MDKTMTVVAVDDHELMRLWIQEALENQSDLQLILGSCGDEVLPLVEQYRPDILLLDLRMPQHNSSTDSTERFQSAEAVRQISQNYPATKIIIVSSECTPGLVRSLLKKGVRGYVLKGDGLSENLPVAIAQVCQGEIYLSETVAQEAADFQW